MKTTKKKCWICGKVDVTKLIKERTTLYRTDSYADYKGKPFFICMHTVAATLDKNPQVTHDEAICKKCSEKLHRSLFIAFLERLHATGEVSEK